MARATRKKHNPNLGGDLQMSFLMPESNWKATPVSELPDWSRAKRIGLDAETKDLLLKDLGPGCRRGGQVVGWAFALEGGPSHYLPYRHEGGDNLPEEEVLNYLRYQARNFKGEIVGANLSYDIDYAGTDDIVFNKEITFRDVQIADPLIYELHFSYSLLNIGKRWGVESKDEELLVRAAKAMGLDPKHGLWRLPARYVGGYAERDVTSPLEIYAKQREKLDAYNLWQVFDVESKVLPVLVRMRQRGVRIDLDKLDEIERWALAEESAALHKIYNDTGVRIEVGEVWKPGALAPAIEALGVRLNRTSTGAPQIDQSFLDSLGHPVASAIKRARKVNKMRTTFAASMHRFMINGRIHCTFNQIAREDEKGDQKGARYGRLSAVDPNLQQQPSPDRDPEIAGEWRKIFIPEEGAIWGCNDYSQQEPRWTTHFAAVMDLPKAKEAAKRFREDPTVDNHDMMTRLIYTDDVVSDWKETDYAGAYKVHRGYSKCIFLGLCYGEGGPKLCHDIGKPTRWALITGSSYPRSYEYFESRHLAWSEKSRRGEGYVKEVAGEEGQDIIDNFDAEVPFVRKVANAASKQAGRAGFVKTILGRRLHFPERDDGRYDWTHKALNRVIQGTSADQMKMALIEIDAAGHFLQLQVHDESNGSYGSVAEAKQVGDIMRDSVLGIMTPEVPFHVDTECGKSWGELE